MQPCRVPNDCFLGIDPFKLLVIKLYNNKTISKYLVRDDAVFLKCWQAITTQYYTFPHLSLCKTTTNCKLCRNDNLIPLLKCIYYVCVKKK